MVNVFVGRIHTPEHSDWRKGDQQQASWQTYELPDTVQKDLQRFMSIIDLSFGAIDMIRHQDGSYVFLEVNPNGEWGMLEKDLQLPISKAIAESLVQRAHYSTSTSPLA